MEEREAQGVVTLDGRGEGLAWIQVGLWFLLVTAAVSQLVTWYAFKVVELGAPREMQSMLVVNRALGLTNSVIHLVGTIALLVGVTMSGRQSRDRAARILFGVSAAGLLVMVAGQLFGLAVNTEQRSFDADSPLLAALRWSWLLHVAARPLVYISLLLALRRGRAVGQPAGDGVLAAVGLVAVAHAALAVAAVVGDPVDFGIGLYGLLLEVALDVVVLGGAVVTVRRARPRRSDGAAANADLAAIGGAGWERAASGLDIFAGALIARAVVALIGALALLLDASGHTRDAITMAFFATLLGNLGCAAVMAVGINRVRAAPEPSAARVASGVAALLLLCCALIDAQFLLAIIRLLAGRATHGNTELRLVGAMAESLVALVAWLALLRCLSALGRRLGDGGGARGARAIAVALVIVVLASALFDRRALAGDWPLGPAMWLPLVGAMATLTVATRLAGLARGLGARMRSGAASGPPLARAVARERDGDG